MRGGYVGNILRINLTEKRITKENLPSEDILRKYIGGTGLAVKILNDEINIKTKPLEPDNKIIFMTGPLTGTKYPCSSDTSAVTLNGNIGNVVGDSHSHGFFGAYMKFAGWDGIIIEGTAEKPVYLWICDSDVQIRDATDIWGKDTHETEDLVKAQVGSDKVSVCAIGPAGENLVHGGAAENDYHHMFAKGGVGRVMGSKRLKAIAIKGTGTVPIADPDKFKEVIKAWHTMAGQEGRRPALSQAGITKLYALALGEFVVHKNMLSPEDGKKWAHNLVESLKDFNIKPKACWSCPVACTYSVEIASGPHKGYTATLAGGGESQEGAAGIVGITDPGTVLYLTDLNDRFGIDSGDPGVCMGLAFELYERGIITKEQTDGLELTWGNAEAAEALLRKIVYKEGFGKVFAEGPKKAAEIIGGDAPKYIIHVKGSGINLHDWRPAWGILLGQVTAGAGACWQGGTANDFFIEFDLGYPDRNTPFTTEGLAEVVAKASMKRLWQDCYGGCDLGDLAEGPGGMFLPARAVAAAVGWEDFTFDEAVTVGHRVVTLERIFNMNRGLTIENDLDIGPRLLEAPTEGLAKGKTIAPHLKGLIMDFYEAMGWDRETGKPLPATLEKLDLTEVASA